MYVCVCVCVCEREREGGGQSMHVRMPLNVKRCDVTDKRINEQSHRVPWHMFFYWEGLQ